MRYGWVGMAALTLAAGAGAQGLKKPVNGIADLPRYTYPYRGDVALLLTRPDLLDPIATKARADLEATLAGYAITDRTTLREMHDNLAWLAMWRLDYTAVRREVALTRAFSDKPLDQRSRDLALLAYADAVDSGAKAGTPAFDAAYRRTYGAALEALPWAVYGDRATQNLGRDATTGVGFLTGLFAPLYQPQADAGGSLNDTAVLDLVLAATVIRDIVPLKRLVLAGDRAYLASHRAAKPDIWAARDVTLPVGGAFTPVVVAIWDSGFDVSLFPDRVWTNPREQVGDRDRDGNGWAGDAHGVGLDENGRRIAAELIAPTPAVAAGQAQLIDRWVGFDDLGEGDDTPEAARAATFFSTGSAAEIGRFFDQSEWVRGWFHGSHVAGIVARGNPAVRMMTVRRNFEWHHPPRRPTEAIARAYAQGYQDEVAYMRAAGVRVANMSWAVDIKTEYEDQLAANGVPPAERAAEATRLFAIEAGGLADAIRSAPDILFVCAAGNSNNSAAFQGSVPAAFDFPNVLTVAAVGQDGVPTSFTTTGPSVDIAADGFRVESLMPGGRHVRASGTSMATPNVVNAAAKLLAVRPTLTVAQLRALLLDTTTPGEGGVRLLNAKAAMAAMATR